MSEWISVNDRLPDNNECVDLWFDFQDHEGRIENCFYDGDRKGFWKWERCGDDMNKALIPKTCATHWMPLPAPPKEK